MRIRPNKRTLCSATLLLTGLLAGRAETPLTIEPGSDKAYVASVASKADRAQLVVGNNVFATDLYKELGQSSKDNLFYSPYSISSALAMTYAGARGETEQQMATTLHFTLPQERLHPTFKALNAVLDNYESNGTFKLQIANALWGQKGYSFLPSYLRTIKKNYSAGLQTVDFANATETARVTINDWVSEKTENKINDLLQPGVIRPDTRLVLTNAIYFLGRWVEPFTKESTAAAPFTLLDGNTVSVPTMNQTKIFKYFEGNDYQAIELPYRDSNVEMMVVLPKAGKLNEIEAALSPNFVTDIASKSSNQAVNLALPKFTFTSEFKLADVLMQMGMPAAFDNADFSGITGKTDLAISQVVHKAFVAVDEDGTEAAAATAVVMYESAMLGHEMKVNRPFIFLIRDTSTGTILFSGRVTNPVRSSDTFSQYDLEYRLLAEFPDVFWNDPDMYPIASLGRERDNALLQFASISANDVEFSTILQHLNMEKKDIYSDDEKVEIYRQHKLLSLAIQMTALESGNYRFVLRIGEGKGERLEGTITSAGKITIEKREPCFNTHPICLTQGTMIATPLGQIPVEEVKAGMMVWTTDLSGQRIAAPVLDTTAVYVSESYRALSLALDDGRTLVASPGHPSSEGKRLDQYSVGDQLDGSIIVKKELVSYDGKQTFDLLPASETGVYWANGIMLQSTIATR